MACRIERNDGDHCRSAPTRQDRLECHRLRHVNARKQYSPSLAAHSANRPRGCTASSHRAPHACHRAPHAVPGPNAASTRISKQKMFDATERRCRRDLSCHQADQPAAAKSLSASTRGKILSPSPNTAALALRERTSARSPTHPAQDTATLIDRATSPHGPPTQTPRRNAYAQSAKTPGAPPPCSATAGPPHHRRPPPAATRTPRAPPAAHQG